MKKSVKRILVLVLAALSAFALCACGSNKKATVSMYDLSKAMLAADDTFPKMAYASDSDEEAETNFTYFSDMDYSKV